MKRLFVFLLFIFITGEYSYSQLSITSAGTNYTIDFDNTITSVNNGQYAGTGFQPAPNVGQLDSDAWEVEGLSSGDLDFGDIETSGDFARGISTGGTSTGGLYAFEVETGNYAFGIQPSTNDWTPGKITLRIQNNTGSVINEINLSYKVWYYNDEDRANSFNFSHSSDNSSYTSEPSLNFTSPESQDVSPAWQPVTKSITLTGLNIGNGSYYYLRWSGNDVSGSDSRDEFGLDDISITASTSSTTPSLIISEVADPETPDAYAKYVEIYNAGSSTVNFGSETWYLTKKEDGTGTWRDVRIDPTKALASGETYVIANNHLTIFFDTYGFSADQESGYIDGNGNDPYFLYYGGDHSAGILIDVYGEENVDGTGELWEYTDSKATRKKHITSPNNVWTASEWVIIPAAASEMTPNWHNRDLTWNGGSTDWSNINNWTGNGTLPQKYPPDTGCDIIIPDFANDPIISGRASCDNMTISSGAVVTINPTNFLVTGSSITNNMGVSGLIVKSNNTGDGMLLLGAGTTEATIERYLTDDMSHFISAPTTNASADDLFQNHNPEVYLYEYHEFDGSYNYLVPTSTPMYSGKGFSTWVEDYSPDFIVAEFDGNLTSSDLTLNSSTLPSLEYSGNAWPWGYNLVGNPFSVPINWRKGSWSTNDLEETIWIWDPDANTTTNPDGSWVWRTSSGGGTNTFYVVPVGQAFFVRTQGSNPSLTIPADARSVYYNQAYYKSSREGGEDSSTYQADYIIVKAMNDLDEDEVWISFNEYGTEDFDNGWDATKLNNSYNTLSVYIPKEIRNQCLEHLPTLLVDEERIVEMNFETTVDGEHTLAIDMTYLPNTNVTLEDLKYNQTQDMKYDSIYSFVAFTDDDPNRFRIHFNKTTTGIEFQGFDHKTDQLVQIYSHNKNIYIKKEDVNSSGYVMVYDLYGREVLSQPLENTSLMKIPVHLNNTYLIVKVISDSKVTTSKVYIR